MLEAGTLKLEMRVLSNSASRLLTSPSFPSRNDTILLLLTRQMVLAFAVQTCTCKVRPIKGSALDLQKVLGFYVARNNTNLSLGARRASTAILFLIFPALFFCNVKMCLVFCCAERSHVAKKPLARDVKPKHKKKMYSKHTHTCPTGAHSCLQTRRTYSSGTWSSVVSSRGSVFPGAGSQ